MPFVLRPPDAAPPALTERLAGLGRARRIAAVAGGTFRLAAVVTAAVGVACALDFAFHLPAVARAFAFAGTLAAAGVLYVRGVRAPGREPAHPLAVALHLEGRFPRLNDALASAVEFLSAGDAADRLGSARFRRVAVVRAQNLADRCDIASIVPGGKAWRAFWLAGVAVMVVGLVAVVNPDRTALALARLADPYGRHPWPTQTTVEVREPAAFPVRHARGEPFVLKFAVRGVIPDHATVQVRLADGPVAADAVELTVPTDPAAAFVPGEVRLDAGRVPRDFEVRITANDADTGWLGVVVAPPPVLRVLAHDRSSGKSAAVRTAVRRARAPVIVTLDGDGQNDPAGIPVLVAALRNGGPGCGLVAAQRIGRKDTAFKRWQSRTANRVRAALLKDGTLDTNCGLKCFPRQVYLDLPFFDGLHRFLPALVRRDGYTVALVDVVDRPRLFGVSNYGFFDRLWVGIADLLGVHWLIRRRPRLPIVTGEDADDR